MKKLKKEIKEMLEIFDLFQIPEEMQRDIIINGLKFSSFVDNIEINQNFDCFKFAKFLRYCKEIMLEFNANEFINNSNNIEYIELLRIFRSFVILDSMSKNDKLKRKIK